MYRNERKGKEGSEEKIMKGRRVRGVTGEKMEGCMVVWTMQRRAERMK